MNEINSIYKLTKFDYKDYFEKGVDFETYLAKMEEEKRDKLLPMGSLQ